MLKLKNIYICESVIMSFSGQPSLINLVSEISANSFPALHPKITVFSSIMGDIGNYKEEIEIISLIDNTTIAKVEGTANIKDTGGNNFIGTFINTIFPLEGKYWIKVTVNGDILTNKEEHLIYLKKI